jgi:hypothetical protein
MPPKISSRKNARTVKLKTMNRLFVAMLVLACAWALEAAPNELTASEKAEGWQLLFDGKSTAGWRSFKKQTFPDKGWVVEDGVLKKVANVQGGDIITTNTFEQFDLRWEWRIPSKANNGIKYFITEERGGPIGHEYQMIDDSIVKNPKQRTGSFYDILPPAEHNALKLPGEWNQSRVLVQGDRVEHWLNGVKILEYELGSEKIKTAVAASKFKDVKGFGERLKGHILLTDHKDEASFRSIKIWELR